MLLCHKKVVYNHKRHGKFKLGNREFEFQLKHHFPAKVTEEFLLVDLTNNLDNLAEDRNEILNKLMARASQMPQRKLKRAVAEYGSAKTKKLLKPIVNSLVK